MNLRRNRLSQLNRQTQHTEPSKGKDPLHCLIPAGAARHRRNPGKQTAKAGTKQNCETYEGNTQDCCPDPQYCRKTSPRCPPMPPGIKKTSSALPSKKYSTSAYGSICVLPRSTDPWRNRSTLRYQESRVETGTFPKYRRHMRKPLRIP